MRAPCVNMAAQQQQHGKSVSTIARFMAHALNTFYCRGAMGTTVNPNTIGCVFDLNTLRVDGEIFESGKKSCGFKNIRINALNSLKRKLKDVRATEIF